MRSASRRTTPAPGAAPTMKISTIAVFAAVAAIAIAGFVLVNSWSTSPSKTEYGPPNAYEITANDNGKKMTYSVTTRFSVILDPRIYPESSFSVSPEGVLGAISNIPVVPAPFYVKRFEVVATGTAIISDKDFTVTINGIE